jgi:hypothetical protein
MGIKNDFFKRKRTKCIEKMYKKENKMNKNKGRTRILYVTKNAKTNRATAPIQ